MNSLRKNHTRNTWCSIVPTRKRIPFIPAIYLYILILYLRRRYSSSLFRRDSMPFSIATMIFVRDKIHVFFIHIYIYILFFRFNNYAYRYIRYILAYKYIILCIFMYNVFNLVYYVSYYL